MADGLCPECGYCLHEVVLNGVCMACDLAPEARTIKPKGPGNVVPLARVQRKAK